MSQIASFEQSWGHAELGGENTAEEEKGRS